MEMWELCRVHPCGLARVEVELPSKVEVGGLNCLGGEPTEPSSSMDGNEDLSYLADEATSHVEGTRRAPISKNGLLGKKEIV